MLGELVIGFQVVRRPDAAFATLRDNDRRYFPPSIVVLLLTSFVSIWLDLPTSIMDAVIAFGSAVGSTVVGASMIYLVGRAFGGNKSWRKVLTVFFYMSFIIIPMLAVFFTLLLLTAGGSALVDLIGFEYPIAIAIATAALGVGLAVIAWIIILGIKAIMVLNGFDAAKAIGVLALSVIFSVLASLIWSPIR